MNPKHHIEFADFQQIDLRIGTVLNAQEFPQATKPAYILQIDFGAEIGVLKSSAQITDLYDISELEGKQVVAVVYFPAKQIGPIQSQCLVTGFHQQNGSVTLCVPDEPVPNGSRLC